MNKLILSAFADEYADNLKEQCEALNKFGIEYIELRGVNGKNVSVLTESEVKETKRRKGYMKRQIFSARRT